ncbi:MAG: type IV toxin-antitoxin system AbiEi family antitoxin domain-containing protein, partial [Chloroflexales bacterium]
PVYATQQEKTRRFSLRGNKVPAEWLRQQQAQEFMTALAEREATGNPDEAEGAEATVNFHSLTGADDAETMGVDRSLVRAEGWEAIGHSGRFVTAREGRSGGTWAHWQIAAAYAHYLDPHFYLQWNEWAMDRTTVRSTAISNLEARVTALEAAQSRQQPAITVADLDSPLHPQAQAIIAALTAVGGGPLSTAEIRSALLRSGVSYTQADQVKTRLSRMAHRGQIERVARGCYLLISAKSKADSAAR